jgi:hypothetical protein
MKKILLIVVSCLFIACMAGSAMAGTSTATVLMPNNITINPNGNDIEYVDVSIIAYNTSISRSPLPQTFTIELEPSEGLEAYIGDSVDIAGTTDTNINVGSSTSWATNALHLSDSFKTTVTGDGQKHTGKLYVKGTQDGTVKVKIYEGGSILADKLVSIESLSVGIPEFPTVALPVAAVLGLLFVFGRKKGDL